MRDPHKLTDIEIAKIQATIKPIYDVAKKKIRRLLKGLLATYEDEIRAHLAEIKNSNTRQEKNKAKKKYIKFFKKEILKSKQFKKICKTIALFLYDANVQSAAYINAKLPEIYVLNYNMVCKEIFGDNSAKITLEFARKNANLALRTIEKQKDLQWNEHNLSVSLLAMAEATIQHDLIVNHVVTTLANKNEDFSDMFISNAATAAENKGVLDALEEAEAEGFELEKTWITVEDRKVRDSHKELHGVTIPVEDMFDNGLMYPGDPDGLPAETMNCRCHLDYVIFFDG